MFLYEAILEETILNEFHYSKKDLQDPEIVNKIIKKTKEQSDKANNIGATIAGVLLLSIEIISGVVSGSILVPIVAFIPAIIGSLSIASKLMDKLFYREKDLDKNLNEIKTKCEKLKEQAKKLKDKESSKKIIDNCNKVLDKIEKAKKSNEEQIKNKDMKKYSDYNNYLEKPVEISNMSGEFSGFLSHLKNNKNISSAQIKNALIKNYKSLSYDNAFDLLFGEDERKNYSELYKKYTDLADEKGKVYVYTYNDDNIDFVSPNKKKLYSITTDKDIYQITGDIINYYNG